jgi:hypothetical protein
MLMPVGHPIYPSDRMFASGRKNLIPREEQTIGERKVIPAIFFSRTSLDSLKALQYDQTYTQEYFIENIVATL